MNSVSSWPMQIHADLVRFTRLNLHWLGVNCTALARLAKSMYNCSANNICLPTCTTSRLYKLINILTIQHHQWQTKISANLPPQNCHPKHEYRSITFRDATLHVSQQTLANISIQIWIQIKTIYWYFFHIANTELKEKRWKVCYRLVNSAFQRVFMTAS